MADIIADSPDASYKERLLGYVQTQKGFLLAAEMVPSLVLACTSLAHAVYAAVVLMIFTISTAFFGLFVTGLDKRFTLVHWPTGDLLRAVFSSGMIAVISVIMLFQEDGAARGAFGLITGVLFAYDAATAYMLLKSPGQQNYNYNLGV